MGEGIVYRCSKCKKEFAFFEGNGMLPIHLTLACKPSEDEMWKELVESKSVLDEVERLMKHYNGKVNLELTRGEDECANVPYGYRLYYASKKKRLYSKLYFELTYEENGIRKTYYPKYVEGGEELILTDGKCEVLCPRCNTKLEANEYFLWD